MEEKTRKLPAELVRVELDGDYQGWWFDARADYSGKEFYAQLKVVASIRDGKTLAAEVYDNIYGLLKRGLFGLSGKPVGEWNFVDEEGEPLALTPKVVDSLPAGFAWTAFSAYVARVRGLPPA